MNKPLTVKELYKDCEKILLQHGDKYVLLTSDDEINDLHYMRDWVITVRPCEIKDLDFNERLKRDKMNYEDFVLLW